MSSAKITGRIVGLLVVIHLVVGLMAPFVMLDRVKRITGLVQGAAASPGQIRAAVLLLFVGSAIAIAISISAFPVIRRFSQAMALWLLAISIAGFCLQSVDNGAILSALSVGQEYAKADAARLDLLEVSAMVVNGARKWTHYVSLLVMVSWIFFFCIVLYRFGLAPRVLAALGILATASQIWGVSLRALLGYAPETRMAMPLAPVYVAIGVWLTAKGFHESHRDVKQPDAELVGA